MTSAGAEDQVLDVLKRYWGYNSFLPRQREAVANVLRGRDSVVVLPTGGGKSLCFQAPAMCTGGLAVVVSPLISLMKDQVDALQSCGVSAACVNSAMSHDDRRAVAEQIRAGRLKLLYMAPERLVQPRTIDFLCSARVAFIAVDEAHCISQWGHDFRPEYRELKVLKQAFPNVGIHAFTATATEQVRSDIAENLGLDKPEMIVGSFDRPNLTYRVKLREDRNSQIVDVLDRHRGESGIVYCIRRSDAEEIAAMLNELGYRAAPYHAGLDSDERRRNQDAFIQEKVETIVATVAFGMGIDKSNVRYVVHAGMPKSLEGYHQESGRAGRDGLEAECVLLYSGGDYGLWKKMLSENGPSADSKRAAAHPGALRSLTVMYDFCTGVICRHRHIVNYFGQDSSDQPCGACDVCLQELDMVDDPQVLGQKIVSCVARLKQKFGAEYTALVLAGSEDQRILQNEHDRLSTWGLLKEASRRDIRNWIEQLVGQGFLQKVGDYNQLQVTASGRRLLRGEESPRLLRPQKKRRESSADRDWWEGVDRGLFERLRELRREQAERQGVPAYIVFGDAALRDMARRRPTSIDGFRQVAGVGEKKCADYGSEFVACIAAYCAQQDVTTDVVPENQSRPQKRRAPNESLRQATKLFDAGYTVQQVAETMGRALSTANGYLLQYLVHAGITDPSRWVDLETARRVEQALAKDETGRLKPVFEALDGTVDYDEIRIVATCRRNRQQPRPPSGDSEA